MNKLVIFIFPILFFMVSCSGISETEVSSEGKAKIEDVDSDSVLLYRKMDYAKSLLPNFSQNISGAIVDKPRNIVLIIFEDKKQYRINYDKDDITNVIAGKDDYGLSKSQKQELHSNLLPLLISSDLESIRTDIKDSVIIFYFENHISLKLDLSVEGNFRKKNYSHLEGKWYYMKQ